MTEERRKSLSLIMRLAWSFKREECGRSFADCLRGAWKCTKEILARAQKSIRTAAGRGWRFAGDLTRAPIKGSFRGQRFAGSRSYRAAYHTAIFGR